MLAKSITLVALFVATMVAATPIAPPARRCVGASVTIFRSNPSPLNTLMLYADAVRCGQIRDVAPEVIPELGSPETSAVVG
jgi:hypothetical protein